MQLFYAPDISSKEYTLSEEESKHCVRVLRKRVGDTIHIIDGRGSLYSCLLINDAPKRCIVEVVNVIEEYEKLPYNLHLAIAPTKVIDRFEWSLEKITEIGVTAITPLESFHSERRQIKDERSVKVVTAAVKQSLKAYHPLFESMCSFNDFVCRDFGDAELFIAHCGEDSDKMALSELLKPHGSYVIAIGPEGDFSTQEVELAKAHGFRSISLGRSRLRTETAAVVAAATVNIICS